MAGTNIFQDVLKNITALKKLSNNVPTDFGKALREVGDELVPECQAVTPVAPVDGGTLRDGIHAEGPAYDGKTIVVKILTSPASAAYALIQHEDLDFLHTTGEAKFIERPLGKASRFISARVAKKVDLAKALR